MAFDKTGLRAYVEEHVGDLIRKVVLGGRSVDIFRKQTGIKSSATINLLDADPVFQNGAACGFNASGDVKLTQRVITTGLIKVNMDLCPETLEATYAEYLIKVAAGKETLPFEEYIVAQIAERIAAKLEKGVWQGDTGSSDPDLARFDGLVKIIGAESTAVKGTDAKANGAYANIKTAIVAIPEAVLNQRGATRVFVSPAIFRALSLELVEKNLFHYNPENGAPEEIAFPGTDVIVTKAVGLAGVDKIYAGNENNFFYGTDLESDAEEIKVWFSDDDDLFKLKARWNSGVQVAFPDEVVEITLS